MDRNIVPIDAARSPLAYALRYARRGWAIFPLWWAEQDDSGTWRCACGKADCKAAKHPTPATLHGQKDATTDESAIRSWWTRYPKANIGLPMSANRLVGIDIDPRNGGLDSIEALEAKRGPLESDVLAFTGGGGEHRVFSLDPEFAGNLPGNLGAGIDVKFNGYLVVEPSNHVSGRQYAWEASSDPLDGAIPSPLPDWIRDEIRQPKPGVLESAPPPAPIDADELARLRAALAAIPSDERETWLRVGMALHNDVCGSLGFELWDTWSQQSGKYNPVDQARVWRSFRRRPMGDAVQLPTIFSMALECKAKSTPPRVAIIAAPAAAPASSDSDLLHPPVESLRAACGWFNGLFDSPTPAITTAGVLALASVLTGRMYRSEFANWTSLLLTVVGPSGVGKNYIKTGIERLLVRADMTRLIAGDFYTHQSALYWALHDNPCHICISDEFGENFQEARRSDNSNKTTVFKALKKVYSDADHIFKAESYSLAGLTKKQRDAKETNPISNPSVTLLGLSTVNQFWGEIRLAHIESGLMNRFVVTSVGKGDSFRHEIGEPEPPQELIDWCKAIRHIDDPLRQTAYDMAPAPFPVQFNDQAKRRFEAFRITQEQTSEQLERRMMGAMPQRWRENAMRMATALAGCASPDAPIVTGEISDWCCRYVHNAGLSAIDCILGNAAENDYHAQSNQVLNLVRAANSRGVSDFEMKGALRGIRRRELADIVAQLSDAGLITLTDRAAGKAGGRPTKAWLASTPVADDE